MGDRAQIEVKHFKGSVYLYSHSGGNYTYQQLQDALNKKWRWDEAGYFTRILFCEMVKGYEMDELGFGIDTQTHGDIEHWIPVIDCRQKKITWKKAAYNCDGEPPPEYTFEEFRKLDLKKVAAKW